MNPLFCKLIIILGFFVEIHRKNRFMVCRPWVMNAEKGIKK